MTLILKLSKKLCFKIGCVCPEVKGNIIGEKCKETFTTIFLGGRSGEEIGFYGGEEFRIAKPSLLFSKTTSGNTKAFLKGA